MEDILASIRRILNEEDSSDSVAGPAADTEAAGEPEEDEALDLSDDMLVAAPPVPEQADPPPVLAAAPAPMAPVVEPEPEVPPAPPPAPPPAAPAIDGLLAPAAAAAASASLGTLLRTVAAERGSAVYHGGPTIEDVVREAIRPMLKDWLDEHLPPLVERLVRAEIERVVGRATL